MVKALEIIKDIWFFIAMAFVALVIEIELKNYKKEKKEHDKYK